MLRHPTVADQLYTASDDATLRLWDANAGTLLRTLEAPGAVESIIVPGGTGARDAYAPQHRRIVVVEQCKTWQLRALS